MLVPILVIVSTPSAAAQLGRSPGSSTSYIQLHPSGIISLAESALVGRWPELMNIKRVRYNPEHVLAITEQGIRYLDDDGVVNFIDFAMCRANWVRFVNESAEFATTNLGEDESRCVAWRDAFHAPPYIEFFTEPRTRFEVVPPPTSIRRLVYCLVDRRRQQFSHVQHAIRNAGWTSFDLG
jgi:hypothetical protein